MTDIDLTQLSEEELTELGKNIEKELDVRKEGKKQEVLEEMKRLAAQLGTPPEELLGVKKRTRRGRPKKS